MSENSSSPIRRLSVVASAPGREESEFEAKVRTRLRSICRQGGIDIDTERPLDEIAHIDPETFKSFIDAAQILGGWGLRKEMAFNPLYMARYYGLRVGRVSMSLGVSAPAHDLLAAMTVPDPDDKVVTRLFKTSNAGEQLAEQLLKMIDSVSHAIDVAANIEVGEPPRSVVHQASRARHNAIRLGLTSIGLALSTPLAELREAVSRHLGRNQTEDELLMSIEPQIWKWEKACQRINFVDGTSDFNRASEILSAKGGIDVSCVNDLFRASLVAKATFGVLSTMTDPIASLLKNLIPKDGSMPTQRAVKDGTTTVEARLKLICDILEYRKTFEISDVSVLGESRHGGGFRETKRLAAFEHLHARLHGTMPKSKIFTGPKLSYAGPEIG